MIDPFFKNLDFIIENSEVNEKSDLLEFLQQRFRVGVKVNLDYEKTGLDHDPIWLAKNPKILNSSDRNELIQLPSQLKSSKFKSKNDAEKDIYSKILEYLKSEKH